MVMFLLLFGVAVICAYVALSINFSYWKKKGVSHPPASMLFGNLGESLIFKKSMGQIYYDIYKKYPSLPYVGFYKLMKPAILVKDPELIKDVMVKEFASFHSNDILINEKADPLIARNPFFVTGESWKKHRTQLTPAFTSKQMKAVFPLMEAVCKTLNKHLEEVDGKNKNSIDAKDLSQKFAMDVVASCAVGLEANSFIDRKTDIIIMAQKIISPSFFMGIKLLFLFAVPAFARFLKMQFVPDDAANYFRNIVAQTMAYRKANNITRNDFLDQMQEMKNKLGEDVFSNEDVTAHSVSFFIDGFETTSIAMSYILYELAANPDLQNKLKLEIDEVLEANGGKFTFDAVHNMSYLNKFISESLRMHPPAMFLGKLSTKPFILPSLNGKSSGVTINPGTPIAIPIYGLHYDPKYYPEPNKFDPERFSEENKSKLVKYTYMPFGEGPRMCLGQKFALAVIKIGIVHLMSKYEIRVNNKTITPLEIDPTYVLLAAKGGIWLDFHKRRDC